MIAGLSSAEVAKLDRDGADWYFDQYAAYMEDAPLPSCYQIRVGTKFLYAGDTMELKQQFLKHWRKLRRSHPCSIEK